MGRILNVIPWYPSTPTIGATVCHGENPNPEALTLRDSWGSSGQVARTGAPRFRGSLDVIPVLVQEAHRLRQRIAPEWIASKRIYRPKPRL